MREIKFRIYTCGEAAPAAYEEDKFYMVYFDIGGADKYVREDIVQGEAPVMQFTGIRDRTGKEIYEGDVVLSPRGEKGQVVFVNAGFYAKYLPPYDWDVLCTGECITTEHEVIGNIHELPEQLKEGV